VFRLLLHYAPGVLFGSCTMYFGFAPETRCLLGQLRSGLIVVHTLGTLKYFSFELVGMNGGNFK
jgi:hypothetical protein